MPQLSRNPIAMGRRAARIAGKSPPSNPRVAAQTMALPRSFGVTVKANAIWLKSAFRQKKGQDHEKPNH